MNKLFFFVSFIFVFIIVSCNSNSNDIKKQTTDSLKITYDKNYEDYLIYRDIYLSKYEKFYKIVKNNNFNDSLIIKIDREIAVEYIILGIYYNEKILNDAVVLFFLKVHLAFLKEKYYPEFFCDWGINSYTPIFIMTFFKISNEPPDKGFVIPTCYNWVKNQPQYLKNKDIKSVVDSIDILSSK